MKEKTNKKSGFCHTCYYNGTGCKPVFDKNGKITCYTHPAKVKQKIVTEIIKEPLEELPPPEELKPCNEDLLLWKKKSL